MVTVHVGDRSFGPVSSGSRGRVRVPVLVGPGVTNATVEVTDKAKLTSSKNVRIRQPEYEHLAAVAIPSQVSDERVRVRVAVAAASQEILGITVSADGEELSVRELAEGLWEAEWAPHERPADGDHGLIVRAEGPVSSEQRLTVQVLPVGSDAPPAPDPTKARSIARVKRRPPPAARRWRGIVGAGVGLTSNLGDLLAPRITAEAGIDYELSWGIIGPRLLFGVSWAQQDLGDPAPLSQAEGAVLLVPIAAGITYRYPARIVEPYATAAFVAQLVRTRTSGDGISERVRHDLAPGFSIAAGVSRPLGPGHLFLQAGYLFSRVEEQEIKLLAGGLVLDVGYRISL
jgi:hypothetical protein